MKNIRLQIFTKEPIEGFCKSRLASTIGEKQATRIHDSLVRLTLEKFAGSSLRCCDTIELWCTPDKSREYFQQLKSKYVITLRQQQGDSLGEIMEHAAKMAFNSGVTVVIQIGTDCPELDIQYINNAVGLLNSNDVVIGPAKDGGYVLLAASSFSSEIYTGIDWGTSSVLSQVINKISRAGLKYVTMDQLEDIDTEDDLQNCNLPVSSYG